VRASRKAFAVQLGTPSPGPSAQATSFRAWLGLAPSAS
jgi:hypothetical protein